MSHSAAPSPRKRGPPSDVHSVDTSPRDTGGGGGFVSAHQGHGDGGASATHDAATRAPVASVSKKAKNEKDHDPDCVEVAMEAVTTRGQLQDFVRKARQNQITSDDVRRQLIKTVQEQDDM